jgi:carboxyl-terminal processing protease
MFLSDFRDDVPTRAVKHKIKASNIRQGKTNTAQIVLDEVEIKSVVFSQK